MNRKKTHIKTVFVIDTTCICQTVVKSLDWASSIIYPNIDMIYTTVKDIKRFELNNYSKANQISSNFPYSQSSQGMNESPIKSKIIKKQLNIADIPVKVKLSTQYFYKIFSSISKQVTKKK